MREKPRPYERYQYPDGKDYQILAIAFDSETQKEAVVYQDLFEPYKIWVRPMELFMGDETNHEDETNHKDVKEEKIELDPLILEFLDSDTYETKINILAALHHRITDDMINTLAIAMDVEVGEGELEQRFSELCNCVETMKKYECTRLR